MEQIAHFDETGGRVAGGCTGSTWPATRRIAIDAGWVLPSYRGGVVALHDGLVVYLRHDQATNGLCNAYHLRELAGIAELASQAWPTQLAELIVERRQPARQSCQRPGWCPSPSATTR